MKSKKVLGGLLAYAVIVVALLSALVVQAPKQAQSETVVGTRSITVLSSVGGAATTVTSDDSYTQFYGTGDCYSIYVAAVAPQTTTVKLQHSADASNWVDNATFTQQTGAGAVFTRVTLYGAYIRAVASVSSTNALTLTVKCTLKNTET